MASKVDICNLALTELGADRIIAIDENTENARRLNAIYDLMRKEVLRDHPWNFAVKRAKLAELAETPVFEFAKMYQIPADSLRVFKVSTGDDDITEFFIEGGKLLTDEGTVYIKYIYDVTDTGLFDGGFVSAFAARLAAELAFPISNDKTLAKVMIDLYGEKLRIAKAMDAQESAESELQGGDFFIEGRI